MMGGTVIDGIGVLVTNQPELGEGPLGLVRDAALVVEEGAVAWVGERRRLPEGAAAERLDCGGRTLIPGFVDSHAHLVFAGDRAPEFAARMAGTPYAAGGIVTTVRATRAASTAALHEGMRRLVDEALRLGTTTLECKSGYGLTVDDEARCLEVAAAHSEEPTFLGAHVAPPEYAGRTDDYVDLVCGAMLDRCKPLARWVDVFCEQGAFDGDQSRAVLLAGRRHGLTPRVHANQLGPGPGARLAVELGAASADHCNHLAATDVEALAGSDTVATLLPAADFCTRSPYPDARRLLDAGAVVALASDCNPGTSYTTSLPLCIALAVREMGMTPEEALWAATAGGARALHRPDIGRLGAGARFDAVLLDAPSYLHLAYRPGVPLTAAVWRAGRLELATIGNLQASLTADVGSSS